MIIAITLALALAGLSALAVMTLALRQHLAAPLPPAPPVWPAVSVLKPMRGADPGLEENLESFLRLDYPSFEVLLGVDDPGDPAAAVARRVAGRHAAVPSRIIVDAHRLGANAKVNNLANLWRHAHHDVLLISDSNVRVDPGYLRELASHLERPGVGLVSSPIRGAGGAGLGATFEALQLNTFVAGGVSAMHRLFAGVCVVGKSMLMRRATLEAIGGFARLSGFLAEDQVCGEEVAARGLRIALARRPVENVLGDGGIGDFLARHLRWARIRWHISPAGYLGELLLNPVAVAALGLLAGRTWRELALLASVLVVKSGLDALAERAVGGRRPLAAYLPLVLAKDLLLGAAWVVPLVSRTVAWRGRRYRIGRRTALEPLPALAGEVLHDAGGTTPAWHGVASEERIGACIS
jgi:ceramide glucosyltransferase